MKIDGIEGLRVSIRVGGSDLQEYDDLTDQSVDPSKAVKYVEASSGSNFLIHTRIKRSGSRRLQPPSKADSLQCDVSLDGRCIARHISDINNHKDDYSKDIDSVTENHDGKFVRRLFQFADLTTDESNDDASKWLDVRKVKSLGEIQIKFLWCRTGKTIPADERSNRHVRYSGQNAIPEKCLKGRAISSQAVLGPFATYVFRYRSHRDLQIEGIIPRSPSPEPGVPLEERDPATLSIEEARELVRILREKDSGHVQGKDEIEPQIKLEGAKRASSQMAAPEDDDDLTVLSEGRSSKRMRGATDEVVDCIDLTGT
ncbi:hypothetical protein KC352_g15232 [Hortaea werneckii]|nr:hypothetical protein KC352_g15232 [Hortaea werneckii]KAI7683650.1 hypothetical protein KC322_g13665 [Hortaea werneckii]